MSDNLKHDSLNIKNSIKRVSKAFFNLRNTLGSGISDDRLDLKINKILNNLQNTSVKRDSYNYAENLRNLLTKSLKSQSSINMQTGLNLLTSPENATRLSRYILANEITDYIPYANRALKVLTDGIISPDSITKDSIQISAPNSTENEEISKSIENLKSIVKTLKIEKKLSELVSDTLKYGDFFIEILDIHSQEVPVTQAIQLSENTNINENLNESGKKQKKTFKESFEVMLPNLKYMKNLLNEDYYENNKSNETKSKKINISLKVSTDLTKEEYETLYKNENTLLKESNNKKENNLNIKDVRLIVHDQKRVIKIQSKKHKTNLGYLIIPETVEADGMMGMATYGSPAGMNSMVGLGASIQNNTGIDSIYNELISIIKHYANTNNTDDVNVNKKELKDLLTRIIVDMEKESQTILNIRYVPPERLEHIQIPNRQMFPYGESIFNKIAFSAKLLIALKTAITTKRMSDASDKRLIFVETSMPRQTANMINSFKEAVLMRKHSVGNFTNISSIPTIMTTNEDYIIPQSKGKRYVEFDTLPAHVNIRDMSEELKFFRDEIIASLEVPPAFLSIEESVNSKSLLAHESAIFAETIINYQKIFSESLFSLFSKLYKYIYKLNLSENIEITFSPPRMLQIEKDAENIDVVGRICDTLFNSLGIPKEYSRKKYLTSVDWDDIEKAEINEKLERRSMPNDENNDNTSNMTGGMGMGMGMGTPMGNDFGGMDMGIQPPDMMTQPQAPSPPPQV